MTTKPKNKTSAPKANVSKDNAEIKKLQEDISAIMSVLKDLKVQIEKIAKEVNFLYSYSGNK